MRRRLLLMAMAAAALFMLAPSCEAGWGHWRHRGWGVHGGGWGPGCCPPCWDSCGLSYGFGTPIGWGYFGYAPYGVDYVPSANYLAWRLPVLSEPAELNFGPLAVRRFLGLDRDLVPAMGLDREPAPANREAERPLVRWSNPETRRKAERLIADGDLLFGKQNFRGALARYRSAATLAPDLAEVYWRQGHALVATSNYEQALAAFQRALALNADVERGGFRLAELYDRAAMTKAAHLESLAEWALARSDSPDAYFLLGLFLKYDGQSQRAGKFFARAAELAGAGGGHIALFLAPPNEAVAAREVDAPPAQPVGAGTEI